MAIGGVDVHLVPLWELLTDRLARRCPVTPLLTLRGDLVGLAPRLLVHLFGGGEIHGQRVDLRPDVALVDVIGLLERTAIVLDGQSLGVLVQAGVGDRAPEPGEHIRGVDADVVARRGDDVRRLGRARMRRVDHKKLARQRVRVGVNGVRADQRGTDVVQLQPPAHIRLVDEPQHRRIPLVGDQQPQAHPAQHLLDGHPPATLVGAQVHQLGDIGQFTRVDTDCGTDVFTHGDRELRQRRPDVLDALEFLGRVVPGDAGGLLRVFGVGGGLPAAVQFGQQFGDLGGEFLTQIPELVGGVGDVDVLGCQHRLIGRSAPRHLFGLRLRTGHLGLQRPEAGAGSADLGVERIAFGLGQIQLPSDVFVLVAELVDRGVQRLDLGPALREPDVVGVGADHRLVHQVDDAQVGRLGGVALLDLLDIAEDLALLLRDGQQFASLHERIDLLERLRQPGQAARLVEHELADELFQSTNAFQRFGFAEQLLSGVGGANADGGVQLSQVLRFDLGREPPLVVFEHPGVESPCRPAVADVLDVAVTVGQHEPAGRVRARFAGQPFQYQAGDRAPGVAAVGDGDGRPRGAFATQVHHLARAAVAALTPRPAHVLVDGAPARTGACRGVVTGGVEVSSVERQEAERNRIEQ